MKEEKRLSPEEFLAAAKQEAGQQNRGKLKIFLGMAAGVGKTYTMLKEAQELHQEGVDIVIGIIDTHGRKETAKLVEGLKVVPEKFVLYKGVELRELDVDAIIKLHPAIVLVDELAHNNAPGSKHIKRWQDVNEILDNQIDVYTTLNIQHIESLNDIIKGITEVAVRETVPDHIVESAASIQLVDLSPDELLERLKEGKIYLKGQSEIAINNFFQRDRLTALREIVLRYTADKIDYDLRKMAPTKEKTIRWKPREKLLVAISHRPQSQLLIRLTRRIAANLDAPWIAVHVDEGTPLSDLENQQLEKNLTLARELGAEIAIVHDLDIAQGIKRIADQYSITQIIVGRTEKNPILRIFKGVTLIDRLSAICENIDIHVIRQERYLQSERRRRLFALTYPEKIIDYFFVLLFVTLFSIVNWLLLPIIGYKIVGMFFLFGILALSLQFRKGPILFASLLWGTIWVLMFVPHEKGILHTSSEDITLIVLFGLTALTMGVLVDRSHLQRDMLQKREKLNAALYDIVTNLVGNNPPEVAIESVKGSLMKFLPGIYEVMSKDADGSLNIDDTEKLITNEKERSTAIWSFENGKEAGWSSDTLPSSYNLYLPIKKNKNEVNGLLIYRPIDNKQISLEEKNFLITVCRHLAHYLERQKGTL